MTLRALALAAILALGSLAGVLAGGGATAVAAGSAGTYTINACSPSTSAGGWTQVNQVPAAMSAGNMCGGTSALGPNDTITDSGALYGEDLIGSTTPVPAVGNCSPPSANCGQAGWELTAPTGVNITGISYYASFETDGGGWLAGLLIDGQPLTTVCQNGLVETNCDCRTNLNTTSPCQVLNNQVAQVEDNLNASSLFFGAECDQVQGLVSCAPNSMTSHAVQADLYSAQVTLVESAQPAVSGEGGGLWGSGPVWGTVPLTFNASDPSGIARVDVLDTGGGDADNVVESCTYAAVQACPNLPSAQLQVNTLNIPDGQEQITIELTNAAGNTTAVRGPTVVVDNNGPPAPGSFTATAVSTKSDLIDLAWADPVNPPEPVQDAYAQLCQTSCGTPIQVSTTGGAQITAPSAGTYTARVWLTDTAGRGSSAQAATTSVTVPAPTTTTTTTTPTPTCVQQRKCAVFKVTSAKWAKGKLKLTIAKLPKGDRLQITISYPHAHKRTTTTSKTKLTITTARPSRILLTALDGKHQQQGARVTIIKLAR